MAAVGGTTGLGGAPGLRGEHSHRSGQAGHQVSHLVVADGGTGHRLLGRLQPGLGVGLLAPHRAQGADHQVPRGDQQHDDRGEPESAAEWCRLHAQREQGKPGRPQQRLVTPDPENHQSEPDSRGDHPGADGHRGLRRSGQRCGRDQRDDRAAEQDSSADRR
ncbi:MAG: hypothetical protein ACRDSR_11675 [Pseudonocardiaceae bacterium]